MPVTVYPAKHGSNDMESEYIRASKTPLDLLQKACKENSKDLISLMQSSFDTEIKRTVEGSENGFVHGAIAAYNSHCHLRIRPEDVWFAILTQLNFYINANAEQLRSKFVTHQDKKKLVLTYGGNSHSMDYGKFAKDMGELIQANVVDPELRTWFMPTFTTTTKDDEVVASILLMGATQSYFKFICCLFCGLPSVTLLGERSDWTDIIQRLEKLKTLGEQPTQWYILLKPIISHFIDSFDRPESLEVVDFWQTIADSRGGGSGPSYYSGWITAFCFWESNGKCLWSSWANALTLGDAKYHSINTDLVPTGYASAPVTVNDNGNKFSAKMIAGSVGIGWSSSHDSADSFDTIQPETGWWMYAKNDENGS